MKAEVVQQGEGGQELIAAARKLRGNPSGCLTHSLRKIDAHLAERGHITPCGRPYLASTIASMLVEK
jgi:hypothetical protein